MKLQPGTIISHSSAPQWGSGKVLDVSSDKVTIIFTDGETRKIKGSHLEALVPADPDSFVEPIKKAAPARTKTSSTTASKPRVSSLNLPRVIAEEMVFTYPKHLKKQFLHDTRGQIEAWQRDYPFLFDVRDASLANDYQGRTLNPHFLEWFAAIKIHEVLGYYSLNEKYESAGHAAKQGTLRKLVSEDAFRFMTTPHQVYGEGLCPELLLYRPDFSDWCFCTVRSTKSALEPERVRYWQELIRITGKRIMQVTIKEAP